MIIYDHLPRVFKVLQLTTKWVSLLFKPLRWTVLRKKIYPVFTWHQLGCVNISVSVATSQWTDEDPKDLPWVCGTHLKFGLFEAFNLKGHPCRKTTNFTRPSIPQFFWLTPACASPVLLEAHRWFGEALDQTPRQALDPWKHDGHNDDQQLYDHVHGHGDGDEFAKALDQTWLQIHCFSLFGEELFQSLIAIVIEIAICHCQCIIIMIHRSSCPSPSKVQVARVLIDMANTIFTW